MNLGKLVRDPELLPALPRRPTTAQRDERSARATG
jgi:hypothetical protein